MSFLGHFVGANVFLRLRRRGLYLFYEEVGVPTSQVDTKLQEAH